MQDKNRPRFKRFQFQDGAVKRKKPLLSISKFPLFQFQDGAVKRTKTFCVSPLTHIFQFQDGAVKRTVETVTTNRLSDFNSKMVRLKEVGIVSQNLHPIYFNSKMVRLKDR